MDDERQQVRVSLFGAPEIKRAGAAVAVDTRKAIAVLALLALTDGPAARDRLCAMFWPESTQSRARSALRRTLSSMRGAVGADAVDADRESVRLAPGLVAVDVVEFIDLTSGDRTADLERAASLYRGDLLDGFTVRDSPEFEDWHRTEAERLRRRADEALAKLVDVASANGDHEAAISFAERRIDLDPLNEPAHRMLLLAEAWAGRRDRAIERYRNAVRILDEDLGVTPLPETTSLYEAIRRGEIPEKARQAIAGDVPQKVPSRTVESPLVGRDEELAEMLDRYRRAAFTGQIIVIEGEAGIGKSRLLSEVVASVGEASGRVAVGHCHEGERDLPYAGLAQLLRTLLDNDDRSSELRPAAAAAVAAIVPGAVDQAPDVRLGGEGVEARIRFFEALRDAIESLCRSDRPALVALDDFHLADHSTAEFIGYLARRISALPLALVLCWRRDELMGTGPVNAMTQGIGGSDAAGVVSLERLTDSDLEQIVRSVAPSDLSADTYREISIHADGVPLFAVEFAKAASAGAISGEEVPERVRSLLRSRLDRAGEIASQVLAAGAVLGRAFPPDLIRAVSGRAEPEVAEALDELESLTLLDHSGTGTSVLYDFTHERLRDVAYDSVPAGRRRLLHRRAADALSSAGRSPPAQVGEAARHAEFAGDPDRASVLYASAGEAARAVHANAEADEYFTAALTLGHDDSLRIREALGDLATLVGDYRRGISEYEGAASVASGSDRARLEHKLGRVYSRRGDWRAAESYFEAALEQSEEAGWGEVLSDLATNRYRMGDGDGARELATRALDLAEENGEAGAVARASNVSGLLARASGDIDEAVERLEVTRRQSMVAADDEMLIAALNNLALTFVSGGEHDRAVALFEDALERCTAIGDRHREAALLSNLGDALFALGRTEDAAASVKRSARIMSEIGVDGEDMIAEVWKLTEW